MIYRRVDLTVLRGEIFVGDLLSKCLILYYMPGCIVSTLEVALLVENSEALSTGVPILSVQSFTINFFERLAVIIQTK